MTGGLIQLITTGIQDAALTANSEITFFKTVYKQHTQFSINNQLKFLGSKKFNSTNEKILEKNGDLLYGQFFKLEIPYFNIIKTMLNSPSQTQTLNINQLEINYSDEVCIIIYYNNNCYLIPENLFKFTNLTSTISSIDSNLVQPYLLPNYISAHDLGSKINYYQVQENPLSPIINIIKFKASYWEQYWIDILCNTKEVTLQNSIVTLLSYINKINNNLLATMYTNYYKNNNYSDYYNFNHNNLNEVQRYFEYVNNDVTNYHETFDIDIVHNYCTLNNLNFNDYINTTLQYNSLVLLYIFQNFYSDNKQIFTFWKKYVIENNSVNTNKVINNYNIPSEWTNNLDNYALQTIRTTNLKNQIYDTYIQQYYVTEINIIRLFSSLNITNITSIYSILNIYLKRFQNIQNKQLQFNDNYNITLYTPTDTSTFINQYNLDNFAYLYNTYLNSIFKNTTFIPVDIINIFAYTAQQVVNNIILEYDLPYSVVAPAVLWSNSIMSRLYKRFLDISNHNIAGNIQDPVNVTLSLYYNIYTANPFTLDEFQNSFFELFYKSSWIGALSINKASMNNLIANIFKLEKNTMDTDINSKTINNNKYLYELKIKNNYNYSVNIDNIDYDNNLIRINYDNNYTKNDIFTVILNNKIINTSKIVRVIENINDIIVTNLLIYSVDKLPILSFITDNLTINVEFKTMIPLLNFYTTGDVITYPNNQITQYTLFSNYSNINKINNDYTITIDNDLQNLINTGKLLVLTIEKIDQTKIIRPLPCTLIYSDSTPIPEPAPAATSVPEPAPAATSVPEPAPVPAATSVAISAPEPALAPIPEPAPTSASISVPEPAPTSASISVPEPAALIAANNQLLNSTKPNNLVYSSIVLQQKNGIYLDNKKKPIIKPKLSTQSNSIIYYYKITYITETSESESSDASFIEIQQSTINKISITVNLPISIDSKVIGRKIYRTNANDNTRYYLISTIFDNSTLSYDDIILSEILFNHPILLPDIKNSCTKIPIKIVNNIIYDYSSNIINLNYNNINEIYIEMIDMNYQIHQIDLSKIIPFGNTSAIEYDNIASDQIYYLMNKSNMRDTIKLTSSNGNYLVPTENIYNISSYVILSIGMYSVVPNLESYISISTDYNFYNNKNISELNDYIFTKPFMMLMNPSQNDSFDNYLNMVDSFTLPYINFLNINFRINSTSIITLNDIDVTYLVPLTSQQYFSKSLENNTTYSGYTSNNNIDFTNIIIDDNNINTIRYDGYTFLSTLSLDFNEYDYSSNDYDSGIRNSMISLICKQYYTALNDNPDISTLFTLISNIDNEINNLYNNTLGIYNISSNSLYGNSSKKILSNINQINNISQINNDVTINNFDYISNKIFTYKHFNKQTINVPILNYNISDFMNKSHNAFNVLSNINNTNWTNQILFDYIYVPYNATNKISNDLIQYLHNISNFFSKHINYINNNIDYLNITNTNNYEDNYYSKCDIVNYLNMQIYDYSNEKQILFLHPLLEDITNITQIIFNNKIINCQYKNNNLTTNDINSEIINNTYVDSRIDHYDENIYSDNKFNYIGIISLDDTQNVTKILDTYNHNYYIKLIDITNNHSAYHYIFKIADLITYQLPIASYHTWIYSQTILNSINYDNIASNLVNNNGNIIFNTALNIPTYSYYSINNIIYYYEEGDMIDMTNNQSNYYPKNQEITSISLISNDIINAKSSYYLNFQSYNNLYINLADYQISSLFDTIKLKDYKIDIIKPILNYATFYHNNLNTIDLSLVLKPSILNNYSYIVIIGTCEYNSFTADSSHTNYTMIKMKNDIVNNNISCQGDISVYWSDHDPLLINTNIVLTYTGTYYELSSDNIFLDIGEFIKINNNFYKVCSYNVNPEYYNLELINSVNYIIDNAYDIINLNEPMNYTEYYTYGSYINYNTIKMPDLNMNSVLVYNYSTYVPFGSSYYDGTYLHINMIDQELNNVFCFTEQSITMQLFYSDGSLYLFDRYIKLKIFDKIIYGSAIYEIKYIKNNKIYLTTEFIIESSLNNSFISIILPYQPFDVNYIMIGENNEIDPAFNNYTVVTSNFDGTLNLLPIINNCIQGDVTPGYQYIRMIKTNFKGNFNNKYTAPLGNTFNQQLETCVEIDCSYDPLINKYKMNNNISILFYFGFYYLQPVYYSGIFNKIVNIECTDYICYITLFNNDNISASNIKLLLSPHSTYNYYTWYKFRYNYSLKVDVEPNMNDNILVMHYIIYQDALYQLAQDHIQYGEQTPTDSSVIDVYFYNNHLIDNNTGLIQNLNFVYNSYQLLLEITPDYNYVHLVKIIYPNKLKIYSIRSINLNSIFYLNKLILIHINIQNEFIYGDQTVLTNNYLIDDNINNVDIVYKYDIKCIGPPKFVNNKYEQEILFLSTNINILNYSKIYLNPLDSISYNIIFDDKYKIISDMCIGTTINSIYTKRPNYIKSALVTNSSIWQSQYKNHLDNTINLNKTYQEYNIFNLHVYNNILNNTYIYYNSVYINNYYINTPTNKIINSKAYNITTPANTIQRILVLIPQYNIDNAELTYNNNAICPLFIQNNINIDNIFDASRYFLDISTMNLKLYTPKLNDIITSQKPWKKWSLLASIDNITSLTQFVYKGYIDINGNFISSTLYSYLTSNEIIELQFFIKNVNNNNFIQLQQIELYIYNNLQLWIENIYFFKNVKDHINDFIKIKGYNAYFNGNFISFNDSLIQEPYITDEFTYDSINNIVYRSNENYNNIKNQIGIWINRAIYSIDQKFGINIHNLLAYLYNLGQELYFIKKPVNIPKYEYKQPLKIIVSELFNKYGDQLKIFNPNYNENLQLTSSYQSTNIYQLTNIYSAITFTNNDINFYGLYSKPNFNEFMLSNEETIYNLSTLFKHIPIAKKLIGDQLFPYELYFDNIKTDSIYQLNFLNGINITNTSIIVDPYLYTNKISFYSDYNITNDIPITINEIIKYTFSKQTLLGTLYNIQFNNINLTLISSVYFKSQLLYINKYSDSIDIILQDGPFINDTFELVNKISIISTNINNGKQFITFYNNMAFNYIVDNTFITIDNNMYILNKLDNVYYINSLVKIINYSVIITTYISPSNITIPNLYVYQLNLNNPFTNSEYVLLNNPPVFADEFVLVGKDTLTISSIYLPADNIIWVYLSNIIDLSSILYLQHIHRINETLPNKIKKITNQNIYLYYINNVINLTANNLIYFYNDNDTSLETGIVSSNIFIKNNNYYIDMNTNINSNDLYDYKFRIKNYWNITNYTSTGNIYSFMLPDDLIINIDNNYDYTITIDNINITIDKTSLVQNNLILSFLCSENITTSFIFNQYYSELNKGMIQIPLQNTKILIEYDYNIQYNISNSFYIIPYTSCGKNLYIFTIAFIFNTYYSTIMLDNIVYNVFSQQYNDNSTIFIISTDNIINQIYEIILDNIIYTTTDFRFYQTNIQNCSFNSQISLNNILVYVSEINDYTQNNNDKNYFYLVSQESITLTNLYKNNIFTQNDSMKTAIVTTQTTQIIVEEPIWNNPIKLFDYIKLYIGDQMIEELNENTYNIDYHLYYSEEKRRQIDNLIIFKPTGNINSWECNFPLNFWFNYKPGFSIPLIALPYTDINIKYKFKDIKDVIKNDLTNCSYTFGNTLSLCDKDISKSYAFGNTLGNTFGNNTPIIKISLTSDTVLLDTKERYLFGSLSHEYIISKYSIYSNYFINSTTSNINQTLSGLVKDIIIITKPINLNTTAYINTSNEYDCRYAQYITASNYYVLFKKTNSYTSSLQKSFISDFVLLKKIDSELIILPQSNRITQLKKSYPQYDLRFLMYYQDKYLYLLSDNRKQYVLTMYLKYLYKNIVHKTEISPIDTFTMKVNGIDLLIAQNNSYFTNVVPYQKFQNTLPVGYYAYSFSLEPLSDQPSGQLNFSTFDSIVFNINSDNRVLSQPYYLSTNVKEYNILRIMSGMGSLAWH